jgi:hypothetical protein
VHTSVPILGLYPLAAKLTVGRAKLGEIHFDSLVCRPIPNGDKTRIF